MTDVLLNELRSYFEDKTKINIKPIEDEGKAISSEILNLLDSLEDTARDFEDDSNDKEAKYANNFAHRLLSSIENVVEPETYRNYPIFSKDIESLVISITRAAKQNLPRIMSKTSRSMLKLFNNQYKKLMSSAKIFSDYIDAHHSDLEIIDDISDQISELEKLTTQKEKEKEQIPGLESKIDSIQKELNERKEALKEIKADDKFANFDEIDENISNLSKTFNKELMPISKAMNKLKKMCDAGRYFMDKTQKEVLDMYDKNSYDAFTKDDKEYSALKAILSQIDIAISENNLTLKDKQRQKTLDAIQKIKSGSLKRFHDEYLKLKTEKDKMLEEIKQDGLYMQKNQLKAKINELKAHLTTSQAELNDTLRRIDSITSKINRVKNEIESDINEIFDEAIEIVI